MGDATVAMAAADPSTTILAVDVHTPGLGVLLRDSDRLGLQNVRVAECDAVTLLSEHIPHDALSGIRIYFPDPWPKQRQHKRRLIQPEFVALANSRLRPGGMFHCATDWRNYADQMLEVLDAEPLLRNNFEGFAPARHGGLSQGSNAGNSCRPRNQRPHLHEGVKRYAIAKVGIFSAHGRASSN